MTSGNGSGIIALAGDKVKRIVAAVGCKDGHIALLARSVKQPFRVGRTETAALDGNGGDLILGL